MTTPNLNEVADRLSEKLIDEGYIVHRYNAVSTPSIYLKLDFGMANTIRISNHRGKDYLNYMWNVGTNVKELYVMNTGKGDRLFFPVDDLNIVLKYIARFKKRRIEFHGAMGYIAKMRLYRDQAKTKPGFWQGAKLLNREPLYIDK